MDAIKAVFGKLFEGFADSWLADALGWWIGLLYGWTSGLVNFLATWWMGLDPLAVGEGSATDRVASSTSFLIPVVGLASTMFAIARAAKAESDAGAETTQITTGLMRLLFVSAAGVTGTYMCMQFASALAPWFFDVITAGAGDDRKLISEAVIGEDTDFLASISGAGYFFALPVMLLASLVQAGMAVGTDVGAAILSAVLPLTAATSVTAKGQEAFAKQVGWILSCISFKPVAAIIYGFGVALINGSNLVPAMVEEDSAGPFLSVLIGTMTLILAACALPALIKLITPSPSILGSGGGRFMAAAGGAAVGAAITTLRVSGGTVTGSNAGGSSGASAADPQASGAGMSSAGSVGSSAGASGASTAAAGAASGGTLLAAQAVASGVSKAKDGIQKGAAATAAGTTGGSEMDTNSAGSQTQESSASTAGSFSSDGASSGESSSSPSGSADIPASGSGVSGSSSGATAASGPSGAEDGEPTGLVGTAGASAADGAPSEESSAGTTSQAGLSPTGSTAAEGSSTSRSGAAPSGASTTQKSAARAPGSSSSRPSGAPAKSSPARPGPSEARTHLENQVQHLIRTAGDETEGAINPEGAEQ